MEAALHPAGAWELPLVVYLDDIMVFGDDQDQLLRDTEEVMKRLASFGFMLNLKKLQLVQQGACVLGHGWSSGGYWAPMIAKLEALAALLDEKLACSNQASLFGLLNFFWEYLPSFAEQVEPLHELLSQD